MLSFSFPDVPVEVFAMVILMVLWTPSLPCGEENPLTHARLSPNMVWLAISTSHEIYSPCMWDNVHMRVELTFWGFNAWSHMRSYHDKYTRGIPGAMKWNHMHSCMNIYNANIQCQYFALPELPHARVLRWESQPLNLYEISWVSCCIFRYLV